MVQRAVRREESVIDPMFYIPEGVDELSYNDEDTNIDVDSSDEEGYVLEFSYDEADAAYDYDGEDIDYSEAPETPQILGVIPPQVIRMSASGSEVVDVILDIDGAVGVSKYEVRVTKI
jgi:hypothetical protein